MRRRETILYSTSATTVCWYCLKDFVRSDLVQEIVALQVLLFGIVEKQHVACGHSRGSSRSMVETEMLVVCELVLSSA